MSHKEKLDILHFFYHFAFMFFFGIIFYSHWIFNNPLESDSELEYLYVEQPDIDWAQYTEEREIKE